MAQFRWTSKATMGAWRNTKNEALRDALDHGQAWISSDKRLSIILRPFATIEMRTAEAQRAA